MKPLILFASFFITITLPSLSQVDTNQIIFSNLDTVRNTGICTNFQGFHCLKNCKAIVENDTLKLLFLESTASTFDDLQIFFHNNTANSKYKTVYVALDTLGITSWNIIKQRIYINSKSWQKGKLIKGYVDLVFQEKYKDEIGIEHYTRQIYFRGGFRRRIE